MSCSNCESDKLKWAIGVKGPLDVPDGRICMREVQPMAYLFCENCSETLDIIYEDKINEILNKHKG